MSESTGAKHYTEEDLARDAIGTGKIRSMDLSYRGHFIDDKFRQEQWSAYLPELHEWISSDVSFSHLAAQVLDHLAALADSRTLHQSEESRQ